LFLSEIDDRLRDAAFPEQPRILEHLETSLHVAVQPSEQGQAAITHQLAALSTTLLPLHAHPVRKMSVSAGMKHFRLCCTPSASDLGRN
jgi:hypothetical protein